MKNVMDLIFLSTGIGFLIIAPVYLISTFVLAYFVPKELVKKYFKYPHFVDGDDLRFEHYPFRYLLTGALCLVTAIPSFARRKQAPDIQKDSPRYWIVLSYLYTWLVMFPILLIHIMMVVLYFVDLDGG